MASRRSKTQLVEQQIPGKWNPTLTDEFIDATTFEQLLEMDDDDQREFSKGIVWNYFEQVKGSYTSIEQAIRQRDLKAISSLGHYLKGSSAAIGLIKLKADCEKIQNYGNKLDEMGYHTISEEEALNKIMDVLAVTKKDFRDAEIWLKRYYGEDPGGDEPV